MQDRVADLFDELRQLSTQYKAEVPGGRRAWPKCIKDRVIELAELGVKKPEIADRSGLPYFTVHSWTKSQSRKKSASSFVQVKVVKKKPTRERLPVTVTVKDLRVPTIAASQIATVTVTTPNGFRIEGLDARAALAWLAELDRGDR
jgi:hypothetical protein